MIARITAVHPDDAYYAMAKIVGSVTEFHPDPHKEEYSVEFVGWTCGWAYFQQFDETKPEWHYFLAIQCVEVA